MDVDKALELDAKGEEQAFVEKALREAFKKDHTNTQVAKRLIEHYLVTQKPDKALAVYKRAKSLDRDCESLMFLAHISLDRKELTLAASILQDASDHLLQENEYAKNLVLWLQGLNAQKQDRQVRPLGLQHDRWYLDPPMLLPMQKDGHALRSWAAAHFEGRTEKGEYIMLTGSVLPGKKPVYNMLVIDPQMMKKMAPDLELEDGTFLEIGTYEKGAADVILAFGPGDVKLDLPSLARHPARYIEFISPEHLVLQDKRQNDDDQD